jgi:hypothetical protein
VSPCMLISQVSLIVINIDNAIISSLSLENMPYGESGPKILTTNKLQRFGLRIVRNPYGVFYPVHHGISVVNTCNDFASTIGGKRSIGAHLSQQYSTCCPSYGPIYSLASDSSVIKRNKRIKQSEIIEWSSAYSFLST